MLKKFFLFLIFSVFTATIFGGAIAQSKNDVLERSSTKYFIKIGDIKGESVDKDHFSWIELESFSIFPPVMSPDGRHVEGGKLTFTKRVDKATPLLYEASFDPGHVTVLKLHSVTTNPDGSSNTMEYRAEDVVFDSFEISGSKSSIPIEMVSLDLRGKTDVIIREVKKK